MVTQPIDILSSTLLVSLISSMLHPVLNKFVILCTEK